MLLSSRIASVDKSGRLKMTEVKSRKAQTASVRKFVKWCHLAKCMLSWAEIISWYLKDTSLRRLFLGITGAGVLKKITMFRQQNLHPSSDQNAEKKLFRQMCWKKGYWQWLDVSHYFFTWGRKQIQLEKLYVLFGARKTSRLPCLAVLPVVSEHYRTDIPDRLLFSQIAGLDVFSQQLH